MRYGDRPAAHAAPSTEVQVDQNASGRDPDTQDTPSAPGHDYEYDEAHDMMAGSLPAIPAPHRVDAPMLVLDQGGDYGYDEAHDFGSR
jgi:hypothetical protein